MLDLKSFVRDVPDFPRKGVLFRDLTPLLSDPRAFAQSLAQLAGRVERPDLVVAIESRGFVFGAGLGLHWRCPLVLARKFGKLPGPTVRAAYALEYGEDTLEMLRDSIRPGQRVAIVDDLLATGGTAAAAARLVEQLEGRVEAMLFVVELAGLGGREQLASYAIEALLELPAS